MTIEPADVLGLPIENSIAAHSTITVIMADYANIDVGGKLNIIGGGAQIVGLVPIAPNQYGMPSQALVVRVLVTPAHHNEKFSLSISLTDETAGVPVSVPQADGTMQALRIQQVAETTALGVPPGVDVAKLSGVMQVVMNIPPGLPLDFGHHYRWIVEIDGHQRASATFQVPSQPMLPVVG